MPINGQRSSTRSCAIETRTDINTVAALARFYFDSGYNPGTLSGLISTIIEDYFSLLSDNKLATRPPSTEEASNYLNEKFGRSTYRRGGATLYKQIAKETLLFSQPSVEHEERSEKDQIMNILMGEKNESSTDNKEI